MKRIIVNGTPRETDVADMAALIAEVGFSKGAVLAEHNGVALRPDEWASAPIRDGDRIELMRIAAGG